MPVATADDENQGKSLSQQRREASMRRPSDTLHGADAPTESEHDHQEEVPESDKPENQPEGDQ